MHWIDITLIAVLTAFGVGLLFFMVYIMFTSAFPNRVTALKIINGKVQVFHSRAKVSRDKKTWRLWNNKIAKFIPSPIEQAIEIDEKGKMSVTCYTDSLGEVTQWVIYDDKSKETTKVIDSAEREIYLDEIRRDNKIGETSILDKILNMIPILVLAGVIVIALFTVPDIYKEHKQVINSQQAMVEANTELADTMKVMMQEAIAIIEDRQVVDGVDKLTGNEVPN